MTDAFVTAPNEIDRAFDGMDEASADFSEKLPPHSTTRIRMTAFVVKGGNPKYGTSAFFEGEVVECSDPTLRPGAKVGVGFHKITDKEPGSLTKLTKGAEFKQAKIREAIAALFKQNPKSAQKWGQITTGLAKDNRPIIGKEMIVKMGKLAKSAGGEYVEKEGFYPVP